MESRFWAVAQEELQAIAPWEQQLGNQMCDKAGFTEHHLLYTSHGVKLGLKWHLWSKALVLWAE